MKRTACALASLMALAGCASLKEPVQQCPAPPPVPGWILEPGPDLQQLLDKLILPYEKQSA